MASCGDWVVGLLAFAPEWKQKDECPVTQFIVSVAVKKIATHILLAF